eukprot:1831696-Prorocentrum_lima.AAC.1
MTRHGLGNDSRAPDDSESCQRCLPRNAAWAMLGWIREGDEALQEEEITGRKKERKKATADFVSKLQQAWLRLLLRKCYASHGHREFWRLFALFS